MSVFSYVCFLLCPSSLIPVSSQIKSPRRFSPSKSGFSTKYSSRRTFTPIYCVHYFTVYVRIRCLSTQEFEKIIQKRHINFIKNLDVFLCAFLFYSYLNFYRNTIFICRNIVYSSICPGIPSICPGIPSINFMVVTISVSQR